MKRIYTTLLTCCLGIAAMSAQQTVFIGETGYDSLQAACDAVTTGGTIRVTGDQTITGRVNISGTKDFTVTGENNAKIINGIETSSLVILLKGNDFKGAATFENITFDGNNKENGQAFFEINSSNSLVIKNCTFTNINSTQAQRTCVAAKGNLTLENVSVTNSANANYNFFTDGKDITVKGTGEYSVFLGKGRRMFADGFTGKITLGLAGFADGGNVVLGGNVANFTVNNAPEGQEWTLQQSGDNVTIKIESVLTSGPVKNATTGKYYLDLASAVGAAAVDDVIEVSESIEMNDRIIPGCNVTIKGVGENITIKRNFVNKLFFASRNHVTFENLTLDCNEKDNDKSEYEVDNASATFNNVKFINSKTAASALMYAKADGRTINANGLSLENNTTNVIELNDGSKMTLTGLNNFAIKCNAANFSITVGEAGLTNTDPISITLPESSIKDGKVVVNGCTNPALFKIEGLGEDLELMAIDGNLVISSGVVEEPVAVNQTTKAEFTTLAAAVSAASDGDVIALLKDITIDDRLDPQAAVTIKSAGETPVTITKNFDNKLIATGNKNISYENLIFDCAKKANSNFEFEVNASGTLSLTNVKVINSATARNVFNVKTKRYIYLTDVTVADCGDAESVNLAEEAKANVSGNNAVSFLLSAATASIAIDGKLTNEKPMGIRMAAPVEAAALAEAEIEPGLDAFDVIVTGAAEADLEKFTLLNSGWYLKFKDNALVATNDDREKQGVSSIAGEEGTVNVYDLTGRTIRTDVEVSGTAEGLPRGMYIIGGRKVVVK